MLLLVVQYFKKANATTPSRSAMDPLLRLNFKNVGLNGLKNLIVYFEIRFGFIAAWLRCGYLMDEIPAVVVEVIAIEVTPEVVPM